MGRNANGSANFHNRSYPMKRFLPTYVLFSALCVIISLTALKPASAAGFEVEISKIADRLGKGETVAVASIHEEKSGDITALGDRWRTRVEARVLPSRYAGRYCR